MYGSVRRAVHLLLIAAALPVCIALTGCSHEPAVKPLSAPPPVTPPMQLRASRVSALRAAAEARGQHMQQMQKH